MTAYVWQFDSLDVYPTYNSLTNVVQSIHWRMTADDGIGHTASACGEQAIGPPDSSSFIPFSQLTFNDIKNWLETSMSVDLDALKMWLDKQIEQQIAPVLISLSPPW